MISLATEAPQRTFSLLVMPRRIVHAGALPSRECDPDMIAPSREMRTDLERFFNPRAIAIIGASQDFNTISGQPLKFLKSHGYKGRLYPVNPRYQEVAGVKCYPALADVPEVPDLALILVNAARVADIVLLSLRVSGTAVAVGTLIGLPLGALLAIGKFPGKQAATVLMNGLMGAPSVVVGVVVYLLLSRSGPLGQFGMLYTPGAMVVAQSVLVIPLMAAIVRQVIEDAWQRYAEELQVMRFSWWQGVTTLLYDCRHSLVVALLAVRGVRMMTKLPTVGHRFALMVVAGCCFFAIVLVGFRTARAEGLHTAAALVDALALAVAGAIASTRILSRLRLLAMIGVPLSVAVLLLGIATVRSEPDLGTMLAEAAPLHGFVLGIFR